MSTCNNFGDFKKYFTENMNDLGLTVPASLFETYQISVGTASAMAGSLHLLGSGATVAELIIATNKFEKLAVAMSFGAAGYTGAVIGSAAVAVGRGLGCGSRISDVFAFIYQTKTSFPGQEIFFASNKIVLDMGNKNRSYFGQILKTSPKNFEYA